MEIEELERDDSLDYIKILKALMELPFQVGKNLLADFLNGNYKNKSMSKNRLDELKKGWINSWLHDKRYTHPFSRVSR